LFDRSAQNRLTRVLKRINVVDGTVVDRGHRPILISRRGHDLVGFEWNAGHSFDSVFRVPYSVVLNAGRTSGSMNVAGFNAASGVVAPLGASHFTIGLAVSVVSDYAYNVLDGQYEAVDGVHAGLVSIGQSGYLSVSDAAVPMQEVVVDILDSAGLVPVLGGSSSVVCTVVLAFYQKVNDRYYLFDQGHGAKVVRVV
jgi:hypothetical protein